MTTSIREGDWNEELQRSGESTEKDQAAQQMAHNSIPRTDISPSGVH